MANEEFGIEVAHLCIRENQTARAEVARYPDEVKAIVGRCSRRKAMGWVMVKKCIDDDIAAAPVLEAYARDHGPLLERCQEKIQVRDLSRIKTCVDQALEVEKTREDK